MALVSSPATLHGSRQVHGDGWPLSSEGGNEPCLFPVTNVLCANVATDGKDSKRLRGLPRAVADTVHV